VLARGKMRARERRQREQVQNESKREMNQYMCVLLAFTYEIDTNSCPIVRMYVNMCVKRMVWKTNQPTPFVVVKILA